MNFKQIIDKMKDAFLNAYKAIHEEVKRHENALEVHRSHAAKYTAKAMSDEARDIKAEHNAIIKAIFGTLSEEKATISEEFEKEVLIAYQPTGAAINEDDVLLLNSGIILKSNEIENLVEKHINNTTMLRIIEGYVDQNEIETSPKIKSEFLHANSEGKFAQTAFEEFVNAADTQTHLMLNSSYGKDVFEKCDTRLEGYYESFISKMHLNKEGESNV